MPYEFLILLLFFPAGHAAVPHRFSCEGSGFSGRTAKVKNYPQFTSFTARIPGRGHATFPLAGSELKVPGD
jgi:hypothetical protein